MTGQYENALDELRNQNAGDIGIDFESEVWSRVSQMENQRLARGKKRIGSYYADRSLRRRYADRTATGNCKSWS